MNTRVGIGLSAGRRIARHFFSVFCSVSVFLFLSFFFCTNLILPANAGGISSDCEGATKKHWKVGGNLSLSFLSDTRLQFTDEDLINLGAHLPGLLDSEENETPDLKIEHHRTLETILSQKPGLLQIAAPWGPSIPADLTHLLYGATRIEWLRRQIYPVHAACIGNDKDGYTLLIGTPGSGKTSLTLHNAVSNGMKIFSGDKTLLKIQEDGTIEAIAGTHTLTVRAEDIDRWSQVPKINSHRFGDRLAFELSQEYYATQKKVQIKKIFLVGLNDGAQDSSPLTPLSALHTLYPFFIDKQREDVLISGGQAVLDGSVPKEVKETLSVRLARALEQVPVRKAIGSLQAVSAMIRSEVLAKSEVPKKILYGICGIGNGHYNRQLSILKHLLEKGHHIFVMTYGEGLSFFRDRFPKHPTLEHEAIPRNSAQQVLEQ